MDYLLGKKNKNGYQIELEENYELDDLQDNYTKNQPKNKFHSRSKK
jgi:hypothetical protein